jgi:hypothetical protein
VLLYKGKGTDPFHIGNYRGLGIDHSLGQLWALVWAERVEVFLRETNGLSVLQVQRTPMPTPTPTWRAP